MVDMAEQDPQPEQGVTAQDGQFVIEKVYVKDLSFEAPNSPQVFLEKWAPEVKLQLRSNATPQNETIHEVVLTVIVTAKQGDKTAYLIEVQQAGVFNIKGFSEHDMSVMLGSFCPNILFPYAREVVSDLVTKGGFPQLLLAPVNFDALYSHIHNQKKSADTAH